MKQRKPDIFLGITMCMLVLAALLCIVIMTTQKKDDSEDTGTPSQVTTTAGEQPTDSGSASSQPVSTEAAPTTEVATPPAQLVPIDEAALKAALDDSLQGLTSEWQVVVIDPALDSKVNSSVNCEVDNWMTANRMTQVFIMGTVFQQDADGTLVLSDVLEDVKSMISLNDTFAADRLTEKLGGGDAEKGRNAVKEFAVANGVQLGFNRTNSGSSDQKNYVSAQHTAEILRLICAGKLVNATASAQMLEILLTPMQGLDIETGLPTEGVRSGFIADVEEGTCVCAMGVVQLSHRNFVVSIVCNKPVTIDGAKKKLTDLITLIAPYFDR